jgi:lipid A 3-O-deacylase
VRAGVAGFAGVVALMLLLGTGGSRPAGAQEVIGAGAKDVGLGVGYSTSHESHRGTNTVTGFHVLGHLGYVATDELAPGWLKGNLELLLEPTLIHLSDKDDSATVVGAAGLVRWLFTGTGRLRPFVEAGLGVVGGQMEFRQTNCDVNFLIEGGPGILIFLSPRAALTAGYRLQHISNADRCEKNLGLNSSLFHVGLSYFFP